MSKKSIERGGLEGVQTPEKEESKGRRTEEEQFLRYVQLNAHLGDS